MFFRIAYKTPPLYRAVIRFIQCRRRTAKSAVILIRLLPHLRGAMIQPSTAWRIRDAVGHPAQRGPTLASLLCWQCLEGVELHRDRTLPSTDSRALNGLIFWFEGYHYFIQSGA